MTKKYTGIIPPIPTPIDERENVDEVALRNLVEHTIETGMDGIFVAGSNGECMGLTQSERDRAIKIVLDQTKGRVPVLAGVMDTSTRRVIENCKRLEDIGGTAAVVTPIFYSRSTNPSETIRHFEMISACTNLDLLIYNIPSYTHNILSPDTVFELAKIDHVVGYKDSSNQMSDMIKCLNHFKGSDFCILQGMVRLAAVSVLLGADGMIPSIATVFPRVCREVFKASKSRDIERMMFWNEIMDRCMEVCSMSSNGTSSTKCALSATGLLSNRMTAPLEPVSESEKEKIYQTVASLQSLIDSIE